MTSLGSGAGSGYGDGYGAGFGDGSGDGYCYGDGFGTGCGYGFSQGYGYGYGDGAGYGYGYGSGYGNGSGYGDGYGDGAGCGDGYGEGVFVATLGDYEVRAVVTPWGRAARVGCQVHDLDTWHERWRVIAREYDVPVSAEEVARLIVLIEAAPMGSEWLPSEEASGG